MLTYLFLGFLLMLAVIGLMVAFTRAQPAALARGLRWSAFGLAGAGLILLPFIGRGSLIALGPAVLIPLLTRFVVRRSQEWSRPGPRSGQASAVETAWLSMTLDHDSGAMDGRVRAGCFAGRNLSALDLPELRTLLDECRSADPDSVPLVEAYLDRVHGPGWRDPGEAGGQAAGASGPEAPGGAGSSPRPPRGGMSYEEAYEILGLTPGAGPEAVKDAHRRLMQKLHPDHGGSTYLAAKINQAKDLLLGN
jgi:hypothetical protein